MDWPELDALADYLYQTWQSGAFKGLQAVRIDGAPRVEAELLVRITLADIDHVRYWQRHHAAEDSWETRRQDLADEMRRLLALLPPRNGS